MRQLDTETRQRVQRVLDRAKAEGRDPVQMLYDYGLLMSPSRVAGIKTQAATEIGTHLRDHGWRVGNPTPDVLVARMLRVVKEVEESYRRGV